MQYSVTIKTDTGKQVTHITAKDLTQAIQKVNIYNQKHPSWEMRLMQVCPMPDNIMMPVHLVAK